MPGRAAARCYHDGVTGRAIRKRQFQHAGAGCLAIWRVCAIVPVFALAVAMETTASTPAFAGQPGVTSSGTAAPAADALVAKLRDLPLPLRPYPPGVAGKGASHPLPLLEVRRQHIYEQLHALGPASVTALARALGDPDPQMRRDVAVALDVLGGGWWHFPDAGPRLDLRPALPALLAALQDSDPGVRAWAAQDIGDIGPAAAAAIPPLRSMLHRADPESRGNACRALGQLGTVARPALPDLRRALADSSPEVRQAASDAIARIERADALN
jgi:HEAT repeats